MCKCTSVHTRLKEGRVRVYHRVCEGTYSLDSGIQSLLRRAAFSPTCAAIAFPCLTVPLISAQVFCPMKPFTFSFGGWVSLDTTHFRLSVSRVSSLIWIMSCDLPKRDQIKHAVEALPQGAIEFHEKYVYNCSARNCTCIRVTDKQQLHNARQWLSVCVKKSSLTCSAHFGLIAEALYLHTPAARSRSAQNSTVFMI